MRFFFLIFLISFSNYAQEVEEVLNAPPRFFIPDVETTDIFFSRREALDLLLDEIKNNPRPKVYLKAILLLHYFKQNTSIYDDKKEYLEIEKKLLVDLLKLVSEDEDYLVPLNRLAFFQYNIPLLKTFSPKVEKKESPFFNSWYKSRQKEGDRSHKFYQGLLDLCQTRYECLLAYHHYFEWRSWYDVDEALFKLSKKILALEPRFVPAKVIVNYEKVMKGEIGIEMIKEAYADLKKHNTEAHRFNVNNFMNDLVSEFLKKGDHVSAVYFGEELFKRGGHTYYLYRLGGFYTQREEYDLGLDYFKRSLRSQYFYNNHPFNTFLNLKYIFYRRGFNKKKQLLILESIRDDVTHIGIRIFLDWEILKLRELLNPKLDVKKKVQELKDSYQIIKDGGWLGSGSGLDLIIATHYCHMYKYAPNDYNEKRCLKLSNNKYVYKEDFLNHLKSFVPFKKTKTNSPISLQKRGRITFIHFNEEMLGYIAIGFLLIFLFFYRLKKEKKGKLYRRWVGKRGKLIVEKGGISQNPIIRLLSIIVFSVLGFGGVLMMNGLVENPLEAGEALVYGVGNEVRFDNWPPEIGREYPDLKLMTHDGKDVQLSDFKGKLILLELVGMTCPGCHAFTGGNKIKEKFHNIRAQSGIKSIHEYATEFGGFDLKNPEILFIQVLAYDLKDKQTKKSDLKLWMDHFYKEGISKNTIVAVPKDSLVSPDTYKMIPTFHLIDRKGVLRSRGKNNKLYDELLPLLGGLAEVNN